MIIDRERVKEIFAREKINNVDIIVILDNICNANCPICVAKHTIKNSLCKKQCVGYKSQCLRCCDRTASDDEFYHSINDLLSSVNGANVRIILSGGEPTLSKRLLPTLNVLDRYTFSQICIETNGAKLLNEEISAELLRRKIEIIFSRYSVLDKENDAVFNFMHDKVAEESVKAIMEQYRGLVTVSCIPLKGCVDSGAKLIEYYDYFQSLGAVDIHFTEAMFDINLAVSNREICDYYNDNSVKISEISAELSEFGCDMVFDSGGAFRIIKHQYGDREILLSAADMSRLATETQNDSKYSRYLVYPSGEVGTNYVEVR